MTWKILIGVVVILGGIGVVGSYILGAVKNPVGAQALWGGVPKNIIPLYTLGMVLSAIGFLASTYYIFFKVDAADVSIWPGLDFRFFLAVYLLILIPSALWMTLTVRMVRDPGPGYAAGIRAVLILTAIGALFMLISMATITPRVPGWSWWLAVTGSVFFFLHTAVLDAVIWTRLFFKNY